MDGIKIALLQEGFEVCTQDEVKAVVKAAVDKLTGAGCTLEEVSVPYHTLLRKKLCDKKKI